MAIVIDEKFKNKLERIKRREWWYAAQLAEVLERPRMYVYRKIQNGEFDIITDGCIMKILSKSVIQFYEEKHHQVY